MKKTVFIIGLTLVLAACSGAPRGGWEWHHPDPGYAEKYRGRDVFECDEYAQTNKMGDRFDHIFGHSDYGSWGVFPFEFCMRERGWYMEYHQAQKPPETAFNYSSQERK